MSVDKFIDKDFQYSSLLVNKDLDSVFIEISNLENIDTIIINCNILTIKNLSNRDLYINKIMGNIKMLKILSLKREIKIKKSSRINEIAILTPNKLIDYKNMILRCNKLTCEITDDIEKNLEILYEYPGEILDLNIRNKNYFKPSFHSMKEEYLNLSFRQNVNLKILKIFVAGFVSKLESIPKKLVGLNIHGISINGLKLDNIIVSSLIDYIENDFTEDEAVKYCEERLIIDNKVLDFYIIQNKRNLITPTSNFMWIDKKFIEVTEKYKILYNYIYKDIGASNNYLYATLNFLQKMALLSCDSRYLKSYPERIYSISNRPKNDMSSFRVSESLTVTEYLDIKKDGWKLIPVTRYATSQMGSHFYPEYKGCGTFYYLEKQSETMLTFKTYVTAKTKYLIYIKLLKLSGKSDEESLEIAEKLLKDKSTISLVYDYSREPDKTYKYLQTIIDTDLYDDYYNYLYGFEDKFDIKICGLAKQLNIDILILTDMVGSQNKKVEEVYDVRDRIDSFRSLVFGFKLEEERWKLNDDMIYQI